MKMKKILFMLIGILALSSIVYAKYTESLDGRAAIVIDITEGWNLVPYSVVGLQAYAVDVNTVIENTDISRPLDISLFTVGSPGRINSEESKTFIAGPFILDAQRKEYVTFVDFWGGWKDFSNEEKRKFDELESRLNDDKDLASNILMGGVWIYSNRDLRIFTTKPEAINAYRLASETYGNGGVSLYRGWNFFSISPDLGTDIFLTDIEGDCDITKAAFWDNTKQDWVIPNPNDIYIQNEDVGAVLAIKVASTCKFEKQSQGLAPPPIPN